MGNCLLCSLLFASVTAIPTVEASADQAGRFVGVHELPVFVRERIELTPGTFDEGEPPSDPRPNARFREDAIAR